MSERDESEWNDQELQALRSLPRERAPDPGLEEQTVARLRQAGLIREPGSAPIKARDPWWRGLWQAPRLAWASAAVAVAVAVFFVGVVVGQHWALRSTADAFATLHHDEWMRASAQVQQTGSAYVEALAALGQLAASQHREDTSQGREVALAALYAAADQLVQLDPNDPLAVRILQGMEGVERASQQVQPAAGREHRVVWY
ncbi:MAG: hypothetical protein GY856_32600 [bacterium]|nr:hypothetical protein [bacterium]